MITAFSRWWQRRRFRKNLASMNEAAVQETKEKWLFFTRTFHLNEPADLAARIEVFVPPIIQFFRNKYPLLLIDASLAWLTILSAIGESGTEDPAELAEISRTLATAHTWNESTRNR